MKSILDESQPTTITIIDNTFEPGQADRTVLPVEVGLTVQEAVREHVTPGADWIVVENGRALSPEEWSQHLITPGTDLICYPRMSGATARMIAGGFLISMGAIIGVLTSWTGVGLYAGGALIMMGIGMLAGGATELIMGPPKFAAVPALSSGDQGSSPTYGFGGIQFCGVRS